MEGPKDVDDVIPKPTLFESLVQQAADLPPLSQPSLPQDAVSETSSSSSSPSSADANGTENTASGLSQSVDEISKSLDDTKPGARFSPIASKMDSPDCGRKKERRGGKSGSKGSKGAANGSTVPSESSSIATATATVVDPKSSEKSTDSPKPGRAKVSVAPSAAAAAIAERKMRRSISTSSFLDLTALLEDEIKREEAKQRGEVVEDPSAEPKVHIMTTMMTERKERSNTIGRASRRGTLTPMKLFGESIPPHILLTMTPAEVKRQEIINEIIFTERQYVTDLKLTVEHFLRPLVAKKLLTRDEIHSLFSNIESLLSVNELIIEELEKRKKDNIIIEEVGDLFLREANMFKLYSAYCSNNRHVATLIKTLQTQSEEFRTFVQAQSSKPLFKGKMLEDFLIQPLQRLCRYPLLLENLLGSTPETHKDHDKLAEALKLLKAIVTQVNERTRQHESVEKLVEIQKRLDSASDKIDLIQPTRFFVREDPVFVFLNEKREKTRCDLVLFNDLIMITIQKKGGTRVLLHAPLAGVLLHELEPSPDSTNSDPLPPSSMPSSSSSSSSSTSEPLAPPKTSVELMIIGQTKVVIEFSTKAQKERWKKDIRNYRTKCCEERRLPGTMSLQMIDDSKSPKDTIGPSSKRKLSIAMSNLFSTTGGSRRERRNTSSKPDTPEPSTGFSTLTESPSLPTNLVVPPSISLPSVASLSFSPKTSRDDKKGSKREKRPREYKETLDANTFKATQRLSSNGQPQQQQQQSSQQQQQQRENEKPIVITEAIIGNIQTYISSLSTGKTSSVEGADKELRDYKMKSVAQMLEMKRPKKEKLVLLQQLIEEEISTTFEVSAMLLRAMAEKTELESLLKETKSRLSDLEQRVSLDSVETDETGDTNSECSSAYLSDSSVGDMQINTNGHPDKRGFDSLNDAFNDEDDFSHNELEINGDISHPSGPSNTQTPQGPSTSSSTSTSSSVDSSTSPTKAHSSSSAVSLPRSVSTTSYLSDVQSTIKFADPPSDASVTPPSKNSLRRNRRRSSTTSVSTIFTASASSPSFNVSAPTSPTPSPSDIASSSSSSSPPPEPKTEPSPSSPSAVSDQTGSEGVGEHEHSKKSGRGKRKRTTSLVKQVDRLNSEKQVLLDENVRLQVSSSMEKIDRNKLQEYKSRALEAERKTKTLTAENEELSTQRAQLEQLILEMRLQVLQSNAYSGWEAVRKMLLDYQLPAFDESAEDSTRNQVLGRVRFFEMISKDKSLDNSAAISSSLSPSPSSSRLLSHRSISSSPSRSVLHMMVRSADPSVPSSGAPPSPTRVTSPRTLSPRSMSIPGDGTNDMVGAMSMMGQHHPSTGRTGLPPHLMGPVRSNSSASSFPSLTPPLSSVSSSPFVGSGLVVHSPIPTVSLTKTPSDPADLPQGQSGLKGAAKALYNFLSPRGPAPDKPHSPIPIVPSPRSESLTHSSSLSTSDSFSSSSSSSSSSSTKATRSHDDTSKKTEEEGGGGDTEGGKKKRRTASMSDIKGQRVHKTPVLTSSEPNTPKKADDPPEVEEVRPSKGVSDNSSEADSHSDDAKRKDKGSRKTTRGSRRQKREREVEKEKNVTKDDDQHKE